MSRLLTYAVRVLESDSIAAAHQVAAVECLLVAINEIPLPAGAALALWRFARRRGSHPWERIAERLGAVDDEQVREDAFRVVVDEGGDAADLAAAVLAGQAHAAHISIELVDTLVDRARTEASARRTLDLVCARHQARDVPRNRLLAIRDRWASEIVPVREVAVTFAARVGLLDGDFVGRMLADPSPVVRSEMAESIKPALGASDVHLALMSVIEHRLRVEAEPSVRASLLRALAAFQDLVAFDEGGPTIDQEPLD